MRINHTNVTMTTPGHSRSRFCGVGSSICARVMRAGQFATGGHRDPPYVERVGEELHPLPGGFSGLPRCTVQIESEKRPNTSVVPDAPSDHHSSLLDAFVQSRLAPVHSAAGAGLSR